ncbi:MAG: hypothetical protein Q7U74_02215, partial [Saprospiraceae bacterium]|nr:hypothetical protein [Saprospiraceae bacterium]
MLKNSRQDRANLKTGLYLQRSIQVWCHFFDLFGHHCTLKLPYFLGDFIAFLDRLSHSQPSSRVALRFSELRNDIFLRKNVPTTVREPLVCQRS